MAKSAAEEAGVFLPLSPMGERIAKGLRAEDRWRRELERFVLDLKLNDHIRGELYDALHTLQDRIMRRRRQK